MGRGKYRELFNGYLKHELASAPAKKEEENHHGTPVLPHLRPKIRYIDPWNFLKKIYTVAI